MKPYTVGIIFARGGSKGIPRKNIKLLNGKPLIAYSIEVAKAISFIDRVIVSTDDDEIASVAKKYGAEVPFIRPTELATDSAPELLSWKHAIQTLEKQMDRSIDILVSLPTTSPLRIVEDIEKSIQKLMVTDVDIVITVTSAHRNPYFNMVKLDGEDNAKIIISSEVPVAQRQTAPQVYDITTVAYAARVPYILKTSSLFEGKVKAVIVPPERALDIDTPLDFEMAEFLMKRKESIFK